MGIIESEADAIAWVHQMAKTPTTGDHEVTDPHPYCLGDDPCCCVQLIAAEETARADEREKAAERVRVETLREARAAVDRVPSIDFGELPGGAPTVTDRRPQRVKADSIAALATLQIVHTLGVK